MTGFTKNKERDGFGVIVIVIAVAALALILGGVGYIAYQKNPNNLLWQYGPVACTQEAKLCPDGSAVGRTGPKCEFAACPNATSSQSQVDTSTWKTYRNDKYGFELKYPAQFKLKEGVQYPGWLQKGVSIQNKNDTIFRVEYYVNLDEISMGAPLPRKNLKDALEHSGDYANITNTFMDNTLGYKVLFHNSATAYLEDQIWIEKEGKFYIISYNARLENNENINAYTDQILSTFKFVTPNASATGTLAGKISIGPICPVESIPPNPACLPTFEAYAAREFLVLSADQTKTIISFHADANGNYSVSLSAGNYMVVSAKTGVGYLSKDLPSTITILSGKTATLNISVDTGIR